MHRFKIICLFAITIACLFSCKKKIVIPLPDEPAKPTLNAFLSQDSIVYARATVSGRNTYFGFNNTDFTTPSNTVVKLYEDGQYIETLHDTAIYDKKYFISNKKISAGKTYRLTAAMPGYDMAEGTNVIPDRNNFTVSDKKVFITASNDNEDINFSFTLKNNTNQKKRYRFRMWDRYDNFYLDEHGDTVNLGTYIDYISLKMEGNGLSILDDNYTDPYVGGIYSIEALKPGESRVIHLKTGNYISSDTVHVELSVITEDSYQYLNSLNDVLKNNDDPTAEKQNVICNIKNGFGIVGGMAVNDVIFVRP